MKVGVCLPSQPALLLLVGWLAWMAGWLVGWLINFKFSCVLRNMFVGWWREIVVEVGDIGESINDSINCVTNQTLNNRWMDGCRIDSCGYISLGVGKSSFFQLERIDSETETERGSEPAKAKVESNRRDLVRWSVGQDLSIVTLERKRRSQSSSFDVFVVIVVVVNMRNGWNREKASSLLLFSHVLSATQHLIQLLGVLDEGDEMRWDELTINSWSLSLCLLAWQNQMVSLKQTNSLARELNHAWQANHIIHGQARPALQRIASTQLDLGLSEWVSA